MNYSDDLKVVWITPMRTGTRSSGELMKKLNFNGLTHEINIPEGKNDYDVIVNIRNPYSRLVSLFHMHKFKNKQFNYKFEDWITKDHYILLDNEYNIYLANRIQKLKINPSKFIRLEKFSEDILSLNFIKNNSELLQDVIDGSIQKNNYEKEYSENGMEKKFWKDYYTEELVNKIQVKLRPEFEYFGYDLNSWK
jgi:hypothetical protein